MLIVIIHNKQYNVNIHETVNPFSFFLKKVDKSPYLNVKCRLYGTSLDKWSWETDGLMGQQDGRWMQSDGNGSHDPRDQVR